jgi:hypothetical protein
MRLVLFFIFVVFLVACRSRIKYPQPFLTHKSLSYWEADYRGAKIYFKITSSKATASGKSFRGNLLIQYDSLTADTLKIWLGKRYDTKFERRKEDFEGGLQRKNRYLFYSTDGNDTIYPAQLVMSFRIKDLDPLVLEVFSDYYWGEDLVLHPYVDRITKVLPICRQEHIIPMQEKRIRHKKFVEIWQNILP